MTQRNHTVLCIMASLLRCVQVLHSCLGYRLTLWSRVLYAVCTVLSGGILFLMALVRADLTLWLFTACPLQQADFVLTTVSCRSSCHTRLLLCLDPSAHAATQTLSCCLHTCHTVHSTCSSVHALRLNLCTLIRPMCTAYTIYLHKRKQSPCDSTCICMASLHPAAALHARLNTADKVLSCS